MVLSDDTVTYEGDPKVTLNTLKTVRKDGVMLSKIAMSLHSGTHVDAPAHYIKNGKTVDRMEPDSLIGRAMVIDLTKVEDSIGKADLEERGIRKGDVVLLKTKNSRLLALKRFSRSFVHLSENSADYLIERKIKAVGIDYLSIEKFGPKENKVHKKLLSNNIPIIEGLNLEHVKPGAYTLVCLPLKIKNGEAAPTRCVLLR